MLFNFTPLSTLIAAWSNLPIASHQTTRRLPSPVFTDEVNGPTPAIKKPNYLPWADSNAHKILKKMVEEGFVRDLTEEVPETFSVNDKGRELFNSHRYLNTVISSDSSSELEEIRR